MSTSDFSVNTGEGCHEITCCPTWAGDNYQVATRYVSTKSYTASCPEGEIGGPVKATVTAYSNISQEDADALALAQAQAEAEADLVCSPACDQDITGLTMTEAGPDSVVVTAPSFAGLFLEPGTTDIVATTLFGAACYRRSGGGNDNPRAGDDRALLFLDGVVAKDFRMQYEYYASLASGPGWDEYDVYKTWVQLCQDETGNPGYVYSSSNHPLAGSWENNTGFPQALIGVSEVGGAFLNFTDSSYTHFVALGAGWTLRTVEKIGDTVRVRDEGKEWLSYDSSCWEEICSRVAIALGPNAAIRNIQFTRL